MSASPHLQEIVPILSVFKTLLPIFNQITPTHAPKLQVVIQLSDIWKFLLQFGAKCLKSPPFRKSHNASIIFFQSDYFGSGAVGTRQ